MQFKVRMTRQPAFNDRMLMGRVIIQNDVDALAQAQKPAGRPDRQPTPNEL